MPYTVADNNVAKLGGELAAAVDAVALVYPKLIYLYHTMNASDFKSYVNSIADGTDGTVQTEIITKTYANIEYIDPFTAYNIFDQVLWPAVSVISPGWSENPIINDDSGNSTSRDFAMRGVVLDDLFLNDNRLGEIFENNFLTKPIYDYVTFVDKTKIIDNLKKVQTTYQKLFEAYNNKTLPIMKDILYSVFTSEAAAKVHFVNTYLCDNAKISSLQSPHRMLQVDPYLAYLTTLFAWLGGIGSGGTVAALNRYKDKNGKSISGRIQDTFKQENWHEIVAGDRPKTAPLTIDMLKIYYEYIQSKKGEYADLYKSWMDKLLTDRKSMINMLVIINERVNVNNSNTFTYQQKPKEYQLALSAAYKKFEMEIGD